MAGKASALVRAQHMQAYLLARRRLYFALKRAMDLVLGGLALLVLAPVMVVIAALIKLDSRGPVLFRQERMGYDRRRRKLRPFVMVKFRSMYNDCEQKTHREHVRKWVQGEIPPENGDVKLACDRRVTRVGRLLRRTSLDELPQLLNVVRGEMSLVGPRPVPLYEVAEYKPCHIERLRATPGLTGLWQVRARSQATIDGMTEMDCQYIRNQSLWLDIKIMVWTIPAVLSGRGAG